MKGTAVYPGRTAIRCPACGYANVAIDSWCARCHEYLDAELILLGEVSAPVTGSAGEGLPALSLPVVARAADRGGPLTHFDIVYPRPRRSGAAKLRRASATLAAFGLILVVVVLVLPATPLAAWRTAVLAGLSSVQLRLPQLGTHSVPPAAGQPATSSAPSSSSASPAASPPDQSAGSSDQSPLVVPAPAPTPVTAAPTPDTSASSQPAPAEPVPPMQGLPVIPVEPQADSAVAAVTLFYQRVVAHDFAGAAALWTPRLQAEDPPDQYITQRFGQTTVIDVRQAQLVGGDQGTATVAVDLVEVSAGRTYHWVGSWQVVQTDSGWLLDRPQFSCCQDAD